VHDTPFGTMAQQVVADRRRCIPLPETADADLLAAAMNPAMSSWLALRLRTGFKEGQSVFVLGATGNAGQMALQIAKLLGAGRVVGAGREVSRVASSCADEIVPLTGAREAVAESIGRAAGDCDIVLDYLWGQPAAQAMLALAKGRRDRSKPLDWVQIGAITAPTMELPSEVLRSTNLRLLGSGQGSVAPRAIVAELPNLVSEILAGRISAEVVRRPLAQVEQAWNTAAPAGHRIVLRP
jgi:NADPH:quinone reductase-like Zn-dependent oxidoreductase